jgi:hypothetical protein
MSSPFNSFFTSFRTTDANGPRRAGHEAPAFSHGTAVAIVIGLSAAIAEQITVARGPIVERS